MFVLSVTVCDIHSQNLHDLESSPLDWAKVKCKYTNRKPLGDFPCIGNSNICFICHHLRENHLENLHNLDFDL